MSYYSQTATQNVAHEAATWASQQGYEQQQDDDDIALVGKWYLIVDQIL